MNSARRNRADASADPIVMPASRGNRDRTGVVVSLQVVATRRENLRAFDALLAGMREARGEDARLESLRDAARAAIANFPVPLLGPGMLRLHRSFEDGNANIANLLDIIVAAERILGADPSRNPAEAFCRAFAVRRNLSVTAARVRILRASRDCEFFAPELVLLLEAWMPPD
jgi:hypothetical protein